MVEIKRAHRGARVWGEEGRPAKAVKPSQNSRLIQVFKRARTLRELMAHPIQFAWIG